MNIAIVPSWYRNKVQPNNGSFFREQAKALANKGHNVVVLDSSLRVKKGWFSSDTMRLLKVKDENITVYSFNFPSLFLGRFPYLYTRVYKFWLKYLIKEMKKDGFIPDIYHGHSIYAAGYSLATIDLNNTSLFVTEHNSLFNNNNISRFNKKILNEVYNSTDRLIVVSDYLKNNINSNLIFKNESNLKTIPNMINDIFKYSPPTISEEFIFLSVGNLIKHKQMDLLIKSFKEAFYNNLNIKLRIVGSGPMKEELENLINHLGMNKQIKLVGDLNRSKLLEEYKKCNAFILLSKSETFGMVYREALAVGRPIISTMNGGISSDIKDENGIFINGDNIKEVKKSLLSMKKNYSDYCYENISKEVLEKYNSNVITDSLISLYKSTLK